MSNFYSIIINGPVDKIIYVNSTPRAPLNISRTVHNYSESRGRKSRSRSGRRFVNNRLHTEGFQELAGRFSDSSDNSGNEFGVRRKWARGNNGNRMPGRRGGQRDNPATITTILPPSQSMISGRQSVQRSTPAKAVPGPTPQAKLVARQGPQVNSVPRQGLQAKAAPRQRLPENAITMQKPSLKAIPLPAPSTKATSLSTPPTNAIPLPASPTSGIPLPASPPNGMPLPVTPGDRIPLQESLGTNEKL